MKAIVQDEFGSPEDVLRVEEIDKPEVGDGDILVGVRAASIHIGDCHGIRGVPYVFRPLYGLRKPKDRVPGTDLAGTVEAVGTSVTEFKPGDDVFGWGKGAFAEYACAGADDLVVKPAELTFEQTSAIGVSAQTALQGLRDHGKVHPEQKVLITGASGGVGTFAVQIAKSFGAEVTGVCSTRNVEMVRSIGADHVIDYTTDDYTQGTERYELILDNVGSHSLSDTRRALTPDGLLLSNGAPVEGWFGPLGRILKVFVSSLLLRQQGRPFAHVYSKADLVAVTELVAAGKVTPVIDRTHPLSEAHEAVAHVTGGHAQGTTVITI